MRCATMIGLAAVAISVGGCVSFEPDYRVDAVEFDPGAVGTWRQVSPPPEQESQNEVVRIDRREVPVSNGRLLGREMTSKRSGAAESSTEAYTVTLMNTDPAGSVELLGYLVRAGEQTFAGVQISEALSVEAQSRSQLVSVPIHVLMRYERTGDTLTVRSPKTMIVWAPMLYPLDGATTPGKELPPLRPLDRPGVLFTPSIDRLVEAYAGYGSDPEFWGEPTVYQRVRE